jgi:hypothetical protein
LAPGADKLVAQNEFAEIIYTTNPDGKPFHHSRSPATTAFPFLYHHEGKTEHGGRQRMREDLAWWNSAAFDDSSPLEQLGHLASAYSVKHGTNFVWPIP